MALSKVANTLVTSHKKPKARLQTEVDANVLLILKGVAALTGRIIGDVVNDLVNEHLARLIDVSALAKGQIINKEEETDAA
jgi:hypothetical protein